MKKALALVFVFCLLLCVAACGKEQAASESANSTAQTATESTDSATPSKTENGAQESTTTTQKANGKPTTSGNNKTTSNKATTTTKAADKNITTTTQKANGKLTTSGNNKTTSNKATLTTKAASTSKSSPSTTQKATTATPLAKAQAAIKAKDYETAYSILYAIKNRNQAEEALFKCFAFQPIEEIDSNHEKTTYTYDKNGYLIKVRYNYGNNYTEIAYTNDSRGNKIKEQRTYNYGSSSEDITSYTYDSNNNLLTIVSNNNVESSKTVNRYDSNNRIVETVHTTDYYVQYKMTYTYDKNGFLASAKYNDLDSDDSSTIIYTCDKNGNVTARNITGTVDSEAMWIKDKATYNSNGDLLTLEFTHSDGTHTKITRTYEENGYIKKIVREDSVNGSSTKNFVCDMYGNVISNGNGSTAYKLFYYPNGSPIKDTPDYNNDYFYNTFYP